MDLTPFVDQFRRDLVVLAETGADAVRTAANQIAASLDPTARIVLLDALVSAADELTATSDVVVDVRLRGREVLLSLQHAATAAPAPPPPPPPPAPPPEDDATSRVSLRLPETLKNRAEDAANAEGMSLNTWLVRAVGLALDGAPPPPSNQRRRGNRLSGWASS